ncbi:MAG TPA: universal stress protein [Candidatus Nitrosotalea sp.]|nr:universal stress protein [Candidatus Nitrosotalea sp.]
MVIKNIKKILVPLDGSKNSFKGLDEAVYLARHFNSSITALCVIPSYPPLPLMGKQIPYEKHILEQVKKFMSNAKKTCVNNKVKFNEKIIKGIATLDISEFAFDNKFDLIVIGSRGMNPVKELFLGSVSNSVVHKSKIPVLIVK